jgi:hypothetical protein
MSDYIQGTLSDGRETTIRCDAVDQLAATATTDEYCLVFLRGTVIAKVSGSYDELHALIFEGRSRRVPR